MLYFTASIFTEKTIRNIVLVYLFCRYAMVKSMATLYKRMKTVYCVKVVELTVILCIDILGSASVAPFLGGNIDLQTVTQDQCVF